MGFRMQKIHLFSRPIYCQNTSVYNAEKHSFQLQNIFAFTLHQKAM